jgi:hypothetical protein
LMTKGTNTQSPCWKCKQQHRGVYFGPETIFIHLPFLENDIPPLLRHVVFQFLFCPFCLNFSLFCIYFTHLLPIFSLLLSPYFLSFPFLPFSHFPLPIFIFFPPKLYRLIFSNIFQTPATAFRRHTRWRPNTPDRMQTFCITSTTYLERLSCRKWQMGLVQRNLSTTAIISATITTSA